MTFAIFTTTLLKILYFLWSDRNRPFFLLGTGVGFFLTAVSFSIDWIKRPKAESQSLFNQYNVSCVFHQRTLFFTKAANLYLFLKCTHPNFRLCVCVCVYCFRYNTVLYILITYFTLFHVYWVKISFYYLYTSMSINYVTAIVSIIARWWCKWS